LPICRFLISLCLFYVVCIPKGQLTLTLCTTFDQPTNYGDKKYNIMFFYHQIQHWLCCTIIGSSKNGVKCLLLCNLQSIIIVVKMFANEKKNTVINIFRIKSYMVNKSLTYSIYNYLLYLILIVKDYLKRISDKIFAWLNPWKVWI
jgi:hypothetical protein